VLALYAAALVVILTIAVWYVTAMPGVTHRGPLPPLSDKEREIQRHIEIHVQALAEEIGERNVWKPSALNDAAMYSGETLQRLGYTVRRQSYEVYNTTVCNLEAEKRGGNNPDEIVLIGAHYDSVIGSPGANDNASGVAAVLEVARLLSNRELDRTVRFVAFVNEEPPFCFTGDMGSRVYAKRARECSEKIVAMLSLETIGCYFDTAGSQAYPFPFGLLYPKTGNFIAFVGNLSSRRLVRRCIATFRRRAAFPSEGVAAPGYLPGIFWSDHWSFWRERYRAVMVTDTAPFRYAQYHTPLDLPHKVDYERTARVVCGVAEVVEELAGATK
jgi:hypothetical protein